MPHKGKPHKPTPKPAPPKATKKPAPAPPASKGATKVIPAEKTSLKTPFRAVKY